MMATERFSTYGFEMCRAYIFGKKIGGQRIHLCGRARGHGGMHGCYCGHKWRHSKGSKLCHTWQAEAGRALTSPVAPSASVLESKVLELFGTRRIDLGEEKKP